MTDGLIAQPDLFGTETIPDQIIRDAVISPDGVYRYRLSRRWGHEPQMVWCMLNPSTADANIDDATVRKCMKFARREGLGGIVIVNLFAFRSRYPDVLRTANDPVGRDNVKHLRQAFADAATVVCGWGAWYLANSAKRGLPPRPRIEQIAKDLDVTLNCLGTSKHGEPLHPLYLSDDTPLTPWRPEATS